MARLVRIGLAVGVLVAGYLGARHLLRGAARAPIRWSSPSFSERGVNVEVGVETDSAGASWVWARYTPTSGFHLYAAELPREGINGVGLPTLVELDSASVLRSAGPLMADQPVEQLFISTLGWTFPVYPAGPVTLRQPIAAPVRNNQAVVSVSYMACSDRVCLPPVRGKRVILTQLER